jgi:hypothetical protein
MIEGVVRAPESVPGQPTDAPPGSARKVRVLMERAARREALFHPGDNMKRLLPMQADAEEDDDDNLIEIDLAG